MMGRTSLTAETATAGAVLDPESSRPLHFGDPTRELGAALGACALADRSDLDRLLGTGPDLLDLLHRLSTQDLRALAPGAGATTVLTTAKGRILERLFVHHLGGRGVLLVVGSGSGPRVVEHLRRYTFTENTGLGDASATTCQLAVVGPRARETAARAGLPVPAALGAATSVFLGTETSVLGGDGLSSEGISVVAPREAAGALWNALLEVVTAAGGSPMGDEALESWRVLRGHPASGRELTEEHNPLEAGLWDAVSFTKGCYVGQEVVARLRTYDKVSRELRGVLLPEGEPPPPPGAPIRAGSVGVGAVTSTVLPPGRRRVVALAYLKKRDLPADGAGLHIAVGEREVPVVLTELPFRSVP